MPQEKLSQEFGVEMKMSFELFGDISNRHFNCAVDSSKFDFQVELSFFSKCPVKDKSMASLSLAAVRRQRKGAQKLEHRGLDRGEPGAGKMRLGSTSCGVAGRHATSRPSKPHRQSPHFPPPSLPLPWSSLFLLPQAQTSAPQLF
jgi:hypothetical protein